MEMKLIILRTDVFDSMPEVICPEEFFGSASMPNIPVDINP
jgi:hypothetical protein